MHNSNNQALRTQSADLVISTQVDSLDEQINAINLVSKSLFIFRMSGWGLINSENSDCASGVKQRKDARDLFFFIIDFLLSVRRAESREHLIVRSER